MSEEKTARDLVLEAHGQLMEILGKSALYENRNPLDKLEAALALMPEEKDHEVITELELEAWCITHRIGWQMVDGITLIARDAQGACITRVTKPNWIEAVSRICSELSLLSPWAARALNRRYP